MLHSKLINENKYLFLKIVTGQKVKTGDVIKGLPDKDCPILAYYQDLSMGSICKFKETILHSLQLILLV